MTVEACNKWMRWALTRAFEMVDGGLECMHQKT